VLHQTVRIANQMVLQLGPIDLALFRLVGFER
jgi:hypothetical protein